MCTGVSQLSPTSGSTWDGTSVASLQLHHEDKGSRTEERGSLTSPRFERGSSNSLGQLGQFSLLDKGLALFDKSKSSVMLNARSSGRDEPPSPRDNHSPRHDRNCSTLTRRTPALSPRSAIVDAEVFYSRTSEHLGCKRQEPLPQERVPPLLPRGGQGAEGEKPPPLPRRPASPPSHNASSEPPPEPPDRPLPSPKHHDLFRTPAMSPKRSPAPAPPISPLPQCNNIEQRTAAFNFPSAVSPSASHHWEVDLMEEVMHRKVGAPFASEAATSRGGAAHLAASRAAPGVPRALPTTPAATAAPAPRPPTTLYAVIAIATQTIATVTY
ncbi:hypothetical protein RR48_08556 [Papilio machaon]|uniref:Uncharacterized protein n=1 Tax=Papilio machaon TaxID=76193 RepID=A0A194RJ54_PAPMA|nr:hypothetical protein RR48_08556 [Papilio machaon]